MSPQMMRFFTLVGIALAAAGMQVKARAESPATFEARAVVVVDAMQSAHALNCANQEVF